MDYRQRDDFNPPLLILMALGGVGLSVSGVLLVWRRWRATSRRPVVG